MKKQHSKTSKSIILKAIIFTILLFLSIDFASAQINAETEKFRNLFLPEPETHNHSFSEQETFVGKILVFYKKFISSQDSGHCMFYPSCSEYAAQTIKNRGLIGLADAFDRLSRCNSYGKNQYKVYKNTPLRLDLPE
jgi:putative component of membrane protein insertase Oxa1/YidC/SpoIIIJ protein YidD